MNALACGQHAPDFWELILSAKYVCVRMCVSVCLPPRLLTTSGMIWTAYDWLNKFYSFYMAAVVIIGSGRGLRIEVHHGN